MILALLALFWIACGAFNSWFLRRYLEIAALPRMLAFGPVCTAVIIAALLKCRMSDDPPVDWV